MRLHTRNSELIVAPSQEFTLVTIQRSHSACYAPTGRDAWLAHPRPAIAEWRQGQEAIALRRPEPVFRPAANAGPGSAPSDVVHSGSFKCMRWQKRISGWLSQPPLARLCGWPAITLSRSTSLFSLPAGRRACSDLRVDRISRRSSRPAFPSSAVQPQLSCAAPPSSRGAGDRALRAYQQSQGLDIVLTFPRVLAAWLHNRLLYLSTFHPRPPGSRPRTLRSMDIATRSGYSVSQKATTPRPSCNT